LLIGLISGGKQNIGVKKQSIPLISGRRAYLVGIKPELANSGLHLAVVSAVGSIRQQELGLALGRIALDWGYDSAASEDAVVFFFGGDDAAFLNAEAFAQFGGNNDCSPFSDLGSFQVPEYSVAWKSGNQPWGQP